MKTTKEAAVDYAEEVKDTTNGMFYADCQDAFKAGVKFAEKWIPIKKDANGFVDWEKSQLDVNSIMILKSMDSGYPYYEIVLEVTKDNDLKVNGVIADYWRPLNVL